jgi:hypothetical protein
MRYILYISILILLSSCSAKWHLKQAYKKDPSLLDSNIVSQQHLIEIPPRQYSIPTPDLRPCINLIEGRTYTNDKGASVSFVGDNTGNVTTTILCPVDTIKVNVPCICPPSIDVQEGVNKWWKWGTLMVLGLMALFLLRKVLT